MELFKKDFSDPRLYQRQKDFFTEPFYPAAKMIRQEDGSCTLWLEKVIPGTSLAEVSRQDDKKATQIFCALLQERTKTSRPLSSFLNWGDFARDLVVLKPLLDPSQVRALEAAWSRREQSTEPWVDLHGDLHHDNVLLSGENWVVIDPHGVKGPPGYELAAFLRNPMSDFPDNRSWLRLFEDRVRTIEESLAISSREILDWALIGWGLSAAWALQDHGRIESAVRENLKFVCAQSLAISEASKI